MFCSAAETEAAVQQEVKPKYVTVINYELIEFINNSSHGLFETSLTPGVRQNLLVYFA